MIEVREIQEKSVWEDFLMGFEHPPFLQSWNAGEQAKMMKQDILRLGIFDADKLVGICHIEQVRARRGNYLYAPYGPVMKEWKQDYLRAVKNYLEEWGSQAGFDFIRFSPFIENSEEHKKLFSQMGFKVSPIHMLSEDHWMLTLDGDDETIMKGMKKNHRNLIRRAIKDGVTVDISTSEEAVNDFIKLMKTTSKRHKFVAYPDKLYHAQVNAFKKDNQVRVYRGYHDGKLFAASIVMYYGKAASYHHGASIRSKVPVPYLTQWTGIQEAIKRECKDYAFWGIVETSDKKHPFYGITHYKKGFGGNVLHLLRCQDYPLTKKYFLTRCIESFRRIKRGFGWKRH